MPKTGLNNSFDNLYRELRELFHALSADDEQIIDRLNSIIQKISDILPLITDASLRAAKCQCSSTHVQAVLEKTKELVQVTVVAVQNCQGGSGKRYCTNNPVVTSLDAFLTLFPPLPPTSTPNTPHSLVSLLRCLQ